MKHIFLLIRGERIGRLLRTFAIPDIRDGRYCRGRNWYFTERFCGVFLTPLCQISGATDNILPYAVEYGGMIAFGFPFVVVVTAINSAIRADGIPRGAGMCPVCSPGCAGV